MKQKFRKWEKRNVQTFVEFSMTKEQLCCNSTKVDGGFDNLRQLIFLEDFKNCISSDTNAHIDEQNAPTLDAAACMADEYALIKLILVLSQNGHFQKGNVNSKQVNKNKNYEGQSSSHSSV